MSYVGGLLREVGAKLLGARGSHADERGREEASCGGGLFTEDRTQEQPY